MSRPAISVIIPAHNRAHTLIQALESVRAQTLPADEVIVVDDGSTDGTADAVRAFSGTVTCISQANQGAAGARNRGIGAARSPWLAFLDSDDLWMPDKLELQAACLEAGPETAMVFGHMEEFASPEWTQAGGAAADPTPRPAMSASAMLARREVFDRVGLFDPGLRAGEFVEWHARASDRGFRSAMLPDVVLRRRLHAGNMVRDRARFHAHTARALKAVLDRRRAAP